MKISDVLEWCCAAALTTGAYEWKGVALSCLAGAGSLFYLAQVRAAHEAVKPDGHRYAVQDQAGGVQGYVTLRRAGEEPRQPKEKRPGPLRRVVTALETIAQSAASTKK